MKKVLLLLFAALAFDAAQGNMANFYADKTIKILSGWIEQEGKVWLSLPGHFVQNPATSKNGGVSSTVSVADPTYQSTGPLSRVGEATLIDVAPAPGQDSSQILRFKMGLKQLKINYDNLEYNDDRLGFFSVKAQALAEGLTTDIAIDITGDGDSCVGSPKEIVVTYDKTVTVTTSGVDYDLPALVNAVKDHFTTHVQEALQNMMSTAVFKSLLNHDYCAGANLESDNPTANVLTDRFLQFAGIGASKYASKWAPILGYWKDTEVEEILVRRIAVNAGYFTSVGTIKRVGDASYIEDEESEFISLAAHIQIEGMTANFGVIQYMTNELKFEMADDVKTGTVSATVSFNFPKLAEGIRPSCNSTSVFVTSRYPSKELQIINLTPQIPTQVTNEVNEVVKAQFLDVQLETSTDDLLLGGLEYAVQQLCQ